MSLHSAHYVNNEPTNQLGYSSLVMDEQQRKQIAHTIPKSQRFGTPKDVKNGNVLPLMLEIEKSQHAGGDAPPKSPIFHANTNTHTQFHDEFYHSHVSMAERVSSPNFKSSVMKQTGHLGMDVMASTDPRVHTMKPNYSLNVGPGSYDLDPMHSNTTGLMYYNEDDSHHMLAFSKDPKRPSPVFRSPTREVADSRQPRGVETSAIASLPPDYSSWTKAGFSTSKEPRVIQSERWGVNAREMRPPPNDLLYDPQVTQDGRAATCYSYSQSPTSPSYKHAFQSGLPRLVALPGGAASDTRLFAKSHAQLCGTAAATGPGCYALEPPRLKSFHAAYSAAETYHSLASQTPPPPSPSSAARRSRRGTAGSVPPSPSGYSMPSSPLGMTRGSQHAASSSAYGYPTASMPSSPAGAAAGAGRGHPGRASADDDWAVHQAMQRGFYQGDGNMLPGGHGGAEQQQQAEVGEDGTPLGTAEEAAYAAAQSMEPLARSHSAPSALLLMTARRAAGRFDSLVFLKRSVPYNSLLRARLGVTADVKRARQEASQQLLST